MAANRFERSINLRPEPRLDSFRYLGVFLSDLLDVLCRLRMDYQFHQEARLSSARLLKFRDAHSLDRSSVKFFSTSRHFVIADPVMCVLKAFNQEGSEFRSVFLRKLRDRLSNLSLFDHVMMLAPSRFVRDLGISGQNVKHEARLTDGALNARLGLKL